MHFDPEIIGRYATPETLKVAAFLGCTFAAWKILSWLCRMLAGLVRTLCVVPILMGALFVGGLGTAGVGVGRWAEWCCTRTGAPLTHEDRMVYLFKRPVKPDELRAYGEFLRAEQGHEIPRSVFLPAASLPRMDLSIGLMGLGSGMTLLALGYGLWKIP